MPEFQIVASHSLSCNESQESCMILSWSAKKQGADKQNKQPNQNGFATTNAGMQDENVTDAL